MYICKTKKINLLMKDLLQKFENKEPEIVFNWKDPETEAEGWTVINSLRGGAAGGGTRMRKGLDMNEVLSLAKTMEVKFSVSGPAIGGAKSGINFDPSDPRKKEVLARWYQAVIPLLKNYYGTGGDLNVDEIHEVIPMTEACGLWHPQEGVINGHFKSRENDKIKQIGQLRYGVAKVIEDKSFSPDLSKKYVVADMITGYGVAVSIAHYYSIYGGDLKGKKAIVQGFGNVGAAAAFYLTQMGVKVVGIIDRVGGLINKQGFSMEEMTKLFNDRTQNTLVAEKLIPFAEINESIWQTSADIFVPAAASRLVTKEQVEKMIGSGLSVIACGANVPFADQEIFFGPISDFADDHLSIIPDFIANCGMARVFAYLMQPGVSMTDEAIFNDTSAIIKKAIQKTYDNNNAKKGIAKTSFEIALKQLV
jgi:glutamate dehydrogenase/leucine dehydrogenase